MSEPVIRVRDLSKVYRVYDRPWDRLRELLSRRPRHRPFAALSEVSFDLPAGEGLGIIGENGAGKSTLLKILAGIVAPSGGTLEVRGKVASILELGSGFHPEFTGRQNIVLNAAMLGLSEEEVRRRIPEIVAFSELGSFIDQPVKCYSTGMAMRLGFSIATQVDPDILIIDEALSVGDGYFQKKCMDRLLALVAEGKTLLFCSHAMYYVTAFCRRALWLRGGEVAALGPTQEVVREYENFLLAKADPGEDEDGERAPETEPAAEPPERPAPARLLSAELVDGAHLYRHGDGWTLKLEWETTDPELSFHVGVGVNRVDGIEVCAFATHTDGLAPVSGRRSYRAWLEVPSLPLVKGEFTLYVFLLDEAGLHIYDQKIIPSAFAVESSSYSFGFLKLEHSWTLPGGEKEAAVGRQAVTV